MQPNVILNNLPQNINVGLLVVIKTKCKDHEMINARLEQLKKDILQFDTRHGDPADCANDERSLNDLRRNIATEQRQLQQIEGILDILTDPHYEGVCNVCEEDILLMRVMQYNSIICPTCAKRAETMH